MTTPPSRWPTKYEPRASGWPAIPAAPRAPDLSDGHCATGRARLPAYAWTGPPADVLTAAGAARADELRELAAVACAWCPVLAACRQWALTGYPLSRSRVAVDGRVIIAGLSLYEVRRLRRRDGLPWT